MKLEGPKPGIRLVIGRPDRSPCVRGVVVGVFPPEDAPAMRELAAMAAGIAEPKARAALEEAQRLYLDSILYGNAYATEPKGIINP